MEKKRTAGARFRVYRLTACSIARWWFFDGDANARRCGAVRRKVEKLGETTRGSFVVGAVSDQRVYLIRASSDINFARRPRYELLRSETLLFSPGHAPVKPQSCARIWCMHDVRASTRVNFARARVYKIYRTIKRKTRYRLAFVFTCVRA